MMGTAIFAWAALLMAAAPGTATAEESHQANGVKVGEVTPSSARVWVRLTANPTPNADGPDPTGPAGARAAAPPIADPDQLRRAVPGAPGRVRLRYGSGPDLQGARATDWAEVDADSDFTHQFRLDGLRPGTVYSFASETTGPGGSPEHAALRGRFETAPPADRIAPVTFDVMTCQAYKDADSPDGFRIYDAIARQSPDFYVAAGDLVYLDSEAPRATTIPLARHHWHRMYGFPKLVAMHLRVPGYFMKDDHDTYFNDGYPDQDVAAMKPLTFREGQRVFHEQNPVGDDLYRTFRWGKDLQIWLVEGRDFRTPNPEPDGPDKSIWGEAQKQWLKESLLASGATWKVLISPTPLVGPDRENKKDNHSNTTYATEGREVRAWLKEHFPEDLFIICGDRHWQYHSVHPETGLHEFGCGPASTEHAGGSPGYDPSIHKFHLQEGGYLSVHVDRSSGEPAIAFEHRDVDGEIVHTFARTKGGTDVYQDRKGSR